MQINIDLTILTNFGKDCHKHIIKKAYQELLDKYQNYIKIFTDGSKYNSFVGCAVHSDNFDAIRFPLPSFYTILSAELFAIKLAVQQTTNIQEKSLILTDSASALQCLLKPYHHAQHPLAKQIISHLNALPSNHVTLAWIPGHKGIEGNELVDKIAKEAALIRPIPNIPVSSTDFKATINNHLHSMWSIDWNNTSMENKLRSIKHSTDPWSTSYQTNRQEETALCKLRIGHSKLTHAYLLEKSPPPHCASCSVQITIQHILTNCPKYRDLRNNFNIPQTLPEALGDDPETIIKLFKFLRTSNLLSQL